MEITSENKKIINVLNILINGVPEDIFSKFPIIALEEKTCDLAGVSYLDVREVINKLIIAKYIEQISNTQLHEFTTILGKAQADKFEEKMRNGEITPEAFYEDQKNKLKDAGIDVEAMEQEMELNPEKEFTLDEILSLNPEIITNNIQEQITKSTRIGNYIVGKNLFDLRLTLENGVSFDNINHENPITLKFDEEQSTLYIKGYKPIRIKKQKSKETTREHSILKFMFTDKDISRKFYHWEFIDNDVYENNLTLEDYYQICRDINTKIKNEIDKEFLDCNSEFTQIRAEYL